MRGGWLASLGHTTTSIPKRAAKQRLKEVEEEKRVLTRKYKNKIEHLNWIIALEKEHLLLPYKRLR